MTEPLSPSLKVEKFASLAMIKPLRSPQAEALINDLRQEVVSGRSSTFNRTFLTALDDPESEYRSVRSLWEQTEAKTAETAKTSPRKFEDVYDNHQDLMELNYEDVHAQELRLQAEQQSNS